jgi:hypothetical protein
MLRTMSTPVRQRAVKRAAIAAILEAFPDEDPPSPAQMRNDHCQECRDTNAILLGKRWQEVTVDDLRHNLPVSLLTTDALRYYLPALMLRSLEAPRELDCLPDSVVSVLSPPSGKPTPERAAIFRALTPLKVVAIREFLRVRALYEQQLSKPLKRALRYWNAG